MSEEHNKQQEKVTTFIARWSASERSNFQSSLHELCDLLDLPRPDPATPDTERNSYVFERPVAFIDGTNGDTSTSLIDLYRRQCFVMVAKQGTDAPGEAE